MLPHDVNFSSSKQAFEHAGMRVRKRLTLGRFLATMRASQVWIGLAALALVLGVRWFAEWRADEWIVVVAVIALWLIGVVLRAFLERPSLLESLTIWDERGGWKDRFSSAFAFLQKASPTEGEISHIQFAEADLGDAEDHLETALPLPKLGVGWIVPVLAFALALSPLLRRPIEAGDELLTDEMKEVAEAEAVALEKEKARLDELAAALDEEEKEDLEALKSDVDQALDELSDAEGETAREMLDALEERAKAADRLAKKLGAGDDGWASAEFLEELSQHPDTTDLASAIKDKNADHASAQADALESLLVDESIKRETQGRVTTALDRSMAKANDEDKTKPVGEHLGNASRKLQAQSPKMAAADFGRLADHFRRVKQREDAQKKLEALAEKLRDSGSKITGSNLEKMEKLAAQTKKQAGAPPGLQKLNPTPQNLQTPMTPSPGQTGAPQSQPGTGQKGPSQTGQSTQVAQQGAPGASGQMGQKGQSAPVPGMGQKGQKGKGEKGAMAAGKPGDGQKAGKGKPMALAAPIPGMTGGAQPGAGLSGGQQGGSSLGGDQAGNATVDLGNEGPTAATKAAKDSQVATMVGKDGDSTFRAIEGQAGVEQAQRSTQQTSAEFIEVQEQALDEAALPLSRRSHVLKYFTALRESFENSEGTGGN